MKKHIPIYEEFVISQKIKEVKGKLKKYGDKTKKWFKKVKESFKIKDPYPESLDIPIMMKVYLKEEMDKLEKKFKVKISFDNKDRLTINDKEYFVVTDDLTIYNIRDKAKGILSNLSEKKNLQQEYQAYFNEILKKHNVDSPSELSGKAKEDFFSEVKDGWIDGEGRKGESVNEKFSLKKLEKDLRKSGMELSKDGDSLIVWGDPESTYQAVAEFQMEVKPSGDVEWWVFNLNGDEVANDTDKMDSHKDFDDIYKSITNAINP